MNLQDLTEYAASQHGIREECRWPDRPGLSVLCHPRTEKWLAVLIRQWNEAAGEMREICELRADPKILNAPHPAWIRRPVRMNGSNWIAIVMTGQTDAAQVFRLLDQAVQTMDAGYTFSLAGPACTSSSFQYRETPLVFADTPVSAGTASPGPAAESIPARLIRMMDLYDYQDRQPGHRARNFLRQARFMADFRDSQPWDGHVRSMFPVYHDLNLRLLRGYFTWRTAVRQGQWLRMDASVAVIYVYELLNLVGLRTPEEALEKLREFEQKYALTEQGTPELQRSLRRWICDFAILHQLDPAVVRDCSHPETMKRDDALSVLKEPADHTDQEVFDALCAFGPKKMSDSILAREETGQGVHLMARIWCTLAAAGENGGEFTACFGQQKRSGWYPLSNAVWLDPEPDLETVYVLSTVRSWQKQGGNWYEWRHESLYFDQKRLHILLRTADRLIREQLDLRGKLKPRPEESWAEPVIRQALEQEQIRLRQQQQEAAKAAIRIDFSSLERIRQDAALTRDSLLTEEETSQEMPTENRGAAAETPLPADGSAPAVKPQDEALSAEAPGAATAPADIGRENPLPQLDVVHMEILKALLEDDAARVQTLLQTGFLMPAVVTDAINEALYDWIGDNALECDGNRIVLAEDYMEDVRSILKGDEDA